MRRSREIIAFIMAAVLLAFTALPSYASSGGADSVEEEAAVMVNETEAFHLTLCWCDAAARERGLAERPETADAIEVYVILTAEDGTKSEMSLPEFYGSFCNYSASEIQSGRFTDVEMQAGADASVIASKAETSVSSVRKNGAEYSVAYMLKWKDAPEGYGEIACEEKDGETVFTATAEADRLLESGELEKNEAAAEIHVSEEQNAVALEGEGAGATALSIETGAAVETSTNSNVYQFPNLVVNVPEGRTVASVTIQFTSAIQSGDKINLPGISGQFTQLTGSKDGNVTINAEGTKTKEEWETYLHENLTISLTGGQTDTRKLRFSASLSKVTSIYDYNAENGHYYLAVQSRTSWTNARDAAAASTYLGMQGYLATVTSKPEQDFLVSLIKMDTWLGGTCKPEYLTGLTLTIDGELTTTKYESSGARYFWATGPEAGQAFWEGGWRQTGTSYPYSNWYVGVQPDNGLGGEYCLHLYGDTTPVGVWNDYYNTQNCAYIIEYGGMPGDTPVTEGTSGSNECVVEINLDPENKTLSTEVNKVLTFGGTDIIVIKNTFNGEDAEALLKKVEDRDLEIRYRYYQVNNDGTIVPLEEAPVHVGNYKVESYVYDKTNEAEAADYTGDSKKFAIVAKELTIENTYTKVYDGTTDFNEEKIALSGIVKGYEDVELTYASGAYNSKDVAAADKVTLTGVALTGKNAGDYTVRLENVAGAEVTFNGKIMPKPVEVTVSSTVTEGWDKLEISPAPVYSNDLADGKLVPGETAALFGAPVYTVEANGTELDVDSPAAGIYTVSVAFLDMDADAQVNYAVTCHTAEINIKTRVSPTVTPSGETPGGTPGDTPGGTPGDTPDGPKVSEPEYDESGASHVTVTDSIYVAPSNGKLTKGQILDFIKEYYVIESVLGDDVLYYSDVTILDAQGNPIGSIDLSQPKKEYTISLIIRDGIGDTTRLVIHYHVGAWPDVDTDTNGNGAGGSVPSKSVNTGDTASAGLFFTALAVSLLVIAGLLFRRRKEKNI